MKNLEFPPGASIGQRCYEATPHASSWAHAAALAGVPPRDGDTPTKRGQRALRAAKRHAARYSLPWPHPASTIRGRGKPSRLQAERARRERIESAWQKMKGKP